MLSFFTYSISKLHSSINKSTNLFEWKKIRDFVGENCYKKPCIWTIAVGNNREQSAPSRFLTSSTTPTTMISWRPECENFLCNIFLEVPFPLTAAVRDHYYSIWWCRAFRCREYKSVNKSLRILWLEEETSRTEKKEWKLNIFHQQRRVDFLAVHWPLHWRNSSLAPVSTTTPIVTTFSGAILCVL